jgi:hypothetical protein
VLVREGTEPLGFLLEELRRLRIAYSKCTPADFERADEALVGVLDYLRDSRVVQTLNSLLRDGAPRLDTQTTPPELLRDLISGEVELALRFGYSEREARYFIKEATRLSERAQVTTSITSCSDLASLLEKGHLRAKSDAVRRTRILRHRKFKKRADTVIYSLGTLVGDGMKPPRFDFSYGLAASLLSSLDD